MNHFSLIRVKEIQVIFFWTRSSMNHVSLIGVKKIQVFFLGQGVQ